MEFHRIIPRSAPSWYIHSTVQPSSVNTAVKKGIPAKILQGDLQNNVASTSCDPTHTPAGSKLGVSSASQSRTRRVIAWGGIECDRSSCGWLILVIWVVLLKRRMTLDLVFEYDNSLHDKLTYLSYIVPFRLSLTFVWERWHNRLLKFIAIGINRKITPF